MNAEQLNSTRLARWSQNGEARLTAETASEWLNAIGFCPYLPLHKSESPAPSFLEAVVGRPAQQPSAGERSRTWELLTRLIEESLGVPLKLGASLGEQPDFVVSMDALRYVYALRGNRNFKAEPSTVGNEKVTPLALHCWQAIQEHGPLDVRSLQPLLGRDMTEAAISRALQELWMGMYVFPILSAKGQPAQWDLLSRRFPQPVAVGAGTGHAEAQSAMVSLYLHATVAAAEEEILAFLSPLAAQSKLREVIRGLGSMRQLDIIDIGGRSHVCLQGGLLPEMVAQLSEDQFGASSAKSETAEPPDVVTGIFNNEIEIEREPSSQTTSRSGAFVASAPRSGIKKFVPKKFAARDSGHGEGKPKQFDMQTSGRRPGVGAASRSSGSRASGDYPPRSARPRKFDSNAGGGPSDRPYSGFARGSVEGGKRPEKMGGRPDRDSRPDGPFRPKRSFQHPGSKPGGFRSGGSKPWESKDRSDRGRSTKPWAGSRASVGFDAAARRKRSSAEDGSRQWEKSTHRPTRDGQPSNRKPYPPKVGGFKSSGFKPRAARPWASQSEAPRGRDNGERTSDRGREERPKRFGKFTPGTRSAGARPYAAKSGGLKPRGGKPWVSKGAESRIGSAKSYAARTSQRRDGPSAGGHGKSFNKPYRNTESARPWVKRPESERDSAERGGDGSAPKRREGRNSPSGAKPGGKPGAKRGAKPFWAKNPRGGKGSVPASRSNRPRVKSGGKKGGKKK